MDSPDFLDVDTEVVADAGCRTTATSEAWASWGGRTRGRFAAAGEEVVSARILDALEGYAAEWQPTIAAVATEVAALGENTTSAADTVTNADTDAADLLCQEAAAAVDQGSTLSRPINGQPAPI